MADKLCDECGGEGLPHHDLWCEFGHLALRAALEQERGEVIAFIRAKIHIEECMGIPSANSAEFFGRFAVEHHEEVHIERDALREAVTAKCAECPTCLLTPCPLYKARAEEKAREETGGD